MSTPEVDSIVCVRAISTAIANANKAASPYQIAKQEMVTPPYVAQLIRLAYLAPDIQEAILQGKVC